MQDTEFVGAVRQYKGEEAEKDPKVPEKDPLERAIVQAIETCKEQNILKEFFEQMDEEDIQMLAMEWNLEDTLAVRFREGEETGLLKGR